MNNSTLLYKIIKGSTITMTKNVCYIDRYKSSWSVVNSDFAQYLIYMEILEEDSGNFETGEVHYKLNEKFYYFKNKIKHIKLNEIELCINNFKYIKTLSAGKIVTEIIEEYSKLKTKLLRKEKLQIINNISKNNN